MVNLSVLPPEVNSALIYSAPGWEKLGAAASEWECFATGFHLIAVSFKATFAGLITNWPGPAGIWMAGAAAHYASRMTVLAAQAAGACANAKAAEKTSKTVFGMAVPPLVIAANRSWLATLATHNLLGQNAHAIAVTEAHYLEMWAQDAVTMNGYVTAFHSEVKTSLSSKPALATTYSTTSTTTAADDCLSAIFASRVTEIRWALGSLLAEGWLLDNVGQLPSGGAASPRSPGGGPSDAASASEGLAMYPIGMLVQAARMSPTGAAELSAKGNGLFNGFGRLVDYVSGSRAERGSDQPTAWVAEVSAQMARALTMGALSIPPAWLSAAPEVGHSPSQLPCAVGRGALTVL
ncbi:PPE family protein [Mycobacterium interjectum]|uniref:PPE family protein n=2 Tax=Mycobacterium interjectum TaxID=33895 RepID=UPI00083624BD|nr:PPE domain-containing protein [Mycobacterium interjectum]